MKISSSSRTSSQPAKKVVVLFGCFVCGETKAGAGLFLVAEGDEMELSSGFLSEADGVGCSFFFSLGPMSPVLLGLRFLTLGQHVGML